MVWCRAALRSDYLYQFTPAFLRATNARIQLKPRMHYTMYYQLAFIFLSTFFK